MSIRNRIATNVGNFLADHIDANENKRKEIIYGLWNFLTIIILLLILEIVKLNIVKIFDLNIPIFTTYVAFSVLRVFLGGFHLSNTTICLLSTSILITIFSIVSTQVLFNLLHLVIAFLIGYIIIYIIGVVDNKNKRYSGKRKTKYRRISFTILSIMFIVNVLFNMFGYKIISNAICIGMLLEMVNLVIGRYYKQG